jgi:hypothetical protein
MSKNIWENILNTCSVTIIGIKIKTALDAINSEYAEEDLDALELMRQCKHVDEIYAIAHEQLGNHEEAKALREYVKNRSQRASYFPHD